MQPDQVSKWVTKSVDVVDAKPRKRAFRNQPAKTAMGGFENYGIFDADSHQICNGEKSAVIDAFVKILPVREFVVLFREQALQAAKAGRIVGNAVEFAQVVDKIRNFFAALDQIP